MRLSINLCNLLLSRCIPVKTRAIRQSAGCPQGSISDLLPSHPHHSGSGLRNVLIGFSETHGVCAELIQPGGRVSKSRIEVAEVFAQDRQKHVAATPINRQK
jgi:hypothetical protein